MKIRDKDLKRLVEMRDKDCLKRPCYWPRKDPGSYTQGIGYKHRSDEWLCGKREINGCPTSSIPRDPAIVQTTSTRVVVPDGVLEVVK